MSYEYLNNYNIKIVLLALSQVKGMGYFSIRKLYENIKPFEIFIDCHQDTLKKLFIRYKIKNGEELADVYVSRRKQLISNAEKLLSNLNNRNINLILEDDIDFPRLLKLIPDRPYWLFVEGSVKILNRERCIAIIGSRKPTEKGIDIAYQITKYLVLNRFIIVSGLAEGIDESAHQATLDSDGYGIGILGHGINITFPTKTGNLKNELGKRYGAVITEFFPNEHYNKRTFVWRDRLQSGLCEVVIPVQGTLDSGTFHTIRYAEQQHKKIIGVYKNKIEDIPQNDIVKYLKEKYQVYNITRSLHKLIRDLEKYYEITLFQLDQLGNKNSNI